jgi:hypothetical protein
MAPWLIITGIGLDDWIYWHLLLQSLVITLNYNNSNKWLPRTRSMLTALQLSSLLAFSSHADFQLSTGNCFTTDLVLIWTAAYIAIGILGNISWLLVSMDTPVDSTATSWFPRIYIFHFRIPGNVFVNVGWQFCQISFSLVNYSVICNC